MKTIKLNLNQEMLVDDCDFERVMALVWTCRKDRNTYYAQCNQKELRGTLAHRFIMRANAGEVIDHINRNGLDNRRSNLRAVTDTQNKWNARDRRDRTGRFRGVKFDKRDNLYIARISVNGRYIHLGCFKDDVSAASVFDEAAKLYRGKFAQLNFPEGREL